MVDTIKIKGRELRPHKATTCPQLGARTVLTNSHWEYVSLWLKREHKDEALFFGNRHKHSQARQPVFQWPLHHCSCTTHS